MTERQCELLQNFISMLGLKCKEKFMGAKFLRSKKYGTVFDIETDKNVYRIEITEVNWYLMKTERL